MSSYKFVQVNEFQPNIKGGWKTIGKIVSWSKKDDRTIELTNGDGKVVQLSFLSATALRVRFNPSGNYVGDKSYAVVNYDLGAVDLNITEHPKMDNGTLVIETGVLKVQVGLAPYGIAIYKGDQLIHCDEYGRNIVYSNEAVANLKKASGNEKYYGFGQKAGAQLNKKDFTMTFFNFDNFTYNDIGGKDENGHPFKMVPEDNDGGPLNPSGPLYNTMPFNLAVGLPKNGQPLYSYGLFFDNVSQTFFNMGANDYSNMDGKYYFGALYGDLDYYVLVGDETKGVNKSPITDVLAQYAELTGPSAMPPKYAFGYHQGGYGYYNRQYIEAVADEYRTHNVPIDGLHIDVDFQDNYRTFTASPEKFKEPKEMFDGLHKAGFKCSTNVTGIVTANPFDEGGFITTPYPTRDDILDLNGARAQHSRVKKGQELVPFIYNTRDYGAPSSDLFIAKEGYGDADKIDTSRYSPSPIKKDKPNSLGTYGYYCDMGRPDVQEWWGKQYEYLLELGLDMIWQDMTCPAVAQNFDNRFPYKTLPLDIMMYDKRTEGYETNAKIHNTFAINLIEATYAGITKIKESEKFENKEGEPFYNYKKRNFIIARGGYAGVHRSAAIWTGDSASSWDFLKINIPEVLNIGLSGQPISGSDIGGFANGSASEGKEQVTNPELFTRWMTSGAFLPWYRNHYDRYTKEYQEPYMYAKNGNQAVLDNCRKYIEIRYRLIQVFYDAMYENTQNGMPIARALFLNDPQDVNVYEHCDDQFFLGKNILVAPIVSEGTEHRNIYLPTVSDWYVFNDLTTAVSAPTRGGTTQNWYVPLNLVPIYVREGAIIPLRELEQYIGALDINPITFQIYPGDNNKHLGRGGYPSGSYTLYQDDETTTAHEVTDGEHYRVTGISYVKAKGGTVVSINRKHDNFTPKEPYFFLAIMNPLMTGENLTITKDGKATTAKRATSKENMKASKTGSYYYDAQLNTLFVKVFDTAADINVSFH